MQVWEVTGVGTPAQLQNSRVLGRAGGTRDPPPPSPPSIPSAFIDVRPVLQSKSLFFGKSSQGFLMLLLGFGKVEFKMFKFFVALKRDFDPKNAGYCIYNTNIRSEETRHFLSIEVPDDRLSTVL